MTYFMILFRNMYTDFDYNAISQLIALDKNSFQFKPTK